MILLRLKQAEVAMADGRLDEAFSLLNRDDARGHRRGQELIGRLAKALVNRGRQHLSADRGGQALVAEVDEHFGAAKPADSVAGK